MKVKYAMSENPHAISLGATVEEAAKVMTAFGVSLLPVIFEGRPVGVVTEHSLTTQVLAWARDPHRTPIREVMNQRPTCLNENDDVELARVVLEHSIHKSALVCRDDGTLSGIVCLAELQKAAEGEGAGPAHAAPPGEASASGGQAEAL